MQDKPFEGNLNGYKRRALDRLANTLGITGSFSNKQSVVTAIHLKLTGNAGFFWNSARFSLLFRDNDTLPQPPQDDQRSMSSLSSLSSLSSVHETFNDKVNSLLEGATADQLEFFLQRVRNRADRLSQDGVKSYSSDSRYADATASASPVQPVFPTNSVWTRRPTRKSTTYEEVVEIPETPPESPPSNPYDQNIGHHTIDKLELDAPFIRFCEEDVNSVRKERCGSYSGEENEHNTIDHVSDERRDFHEDEGEIFSRSQEVSEWSGEGGQPVDASYLYKYRNYVEEKDRALSYHGSQYDGDNNKCSSTCANVGDTSSEEVLVVSTTVGYKYPEENLDKSYIDHECMQMEGDDDLPSTISDGSVEEVHDSMTGILAYPQAIESYMEDFIRIHRRLFTREFDLDAFMQEKLGNWESLVRVTGQYIIALANDKEEPQIQILGIMKELIQAIESSGG